MSAGFANQLRILRDGDKSAAVGVVAAVRYLAEFGRSAVAPDVKWRLEVSRYRADSGEVRWPDPEYQDEHPGQAWRGLFVAATDMSWIIFTVLGNKHGADDWYDRFVTESDAVAEAIFEQRSGTNDPLTHFPSR